MTGFWPLFSGFPCSAEARLFCSELQIPFCDNKSCGEFLRLSVVTKQYFSVLAREISKIKANLFCVIKIFLRCVESSHNKVSSWCYCSMLEQKT